MNGIINPQLKRLDVKAIKKAQSSPEKCLPVVLVGDRAAALPADQLTKFTRSLADGNRVVTLFDLVAEMIGVKKQALVYQETRAALIEKKFGEEPIVATSITIPSVTKPTKIVMPENVLDFKKIVEPPAPSLRK